MSLNGNQEYVITMGDSPPQEKEEVRIMRCNYCTNYMTPGIVHAKCEGKLRNLEWQVHRLFGKKK